jgi:hypothetical protein
MDAIGSRFHERVSFVSSMSSSLRMPQKGTSHTHSNRFSRVNWNLRAAL